MRLFVLFLFCGLFWWRCLSSANPISWFIFVRALPSLKTITTYNKVWHNSRTDKKTNKQSSSYTNSYRPANIYIFFECTVSGEKDLIHTADRKSLLAARRVRRGTLWTCCTSSVCCPGRAVEERLASSRPVDSAECFSLSALWFVMGHSLCGWLNYWVVNTVIQKVCQKWEFCRARRGPIQQQTVGTGWY